MCLCVKMTKGQLHLLSSSQKIGVICEEGTSSWENTSISLACRQDCGVFSWLMIDRLQVTLLKHPLGEGVRRHQKVPGSKMQPGIKWVAELTADLFNKEAGPVYIPLSKVPLAQVSDSAALSSTHWYLQSGVSASAVTGCSGKPWVISGKTYVSRMLMRLTWAGQLWLV